MTDLELMQLLEDEGYEASIENLLVLKEGLENDEIQLSEADSLTKKMRANGGVNSFEYKNATQDQRNKFDTNEQGRKASVTVGAQRKYKKDSYASSSLADRAIEQVEKGKALKAKSIDTTEEAPEDTGNHGKNPRKTVNSEIVFRGNSIRPIGAAEASIVRRKHEIKSKKAGLSHKTKSQPAYITKYLREDFSDYELYQILESNGYTTTEANLEILKEGLETGRYYIED